MTRFSDAVVRTCATIAFGAVSVAMVPTAQAQISAGAIPAEFPPASYTANQYIDSAGCAFIRAGISGAVSWVPRVNRSRDQLCGFQPSFASAPPPEPAPVAAPVPEIVVAAPVPTVAAPVIAAPIAAAPIAAALPRPRNTNVGAPTATVASLITPPRIGAAATTTPVVAPVAPVAAPVSAPVSASVSEPRPVSQAVACAGLFGVQANLINARTGDPINCGPAPRAVPTAVAASTFAVPRVAASPEPLRLTMAEVCSRMASTGQSFINQATGQPVVCPTAPVVAPVVVASAAIPSGPAAPRAPALVASAGSCSGVTNIGGTDRYPVRCGPQALSPSGVATGSVAAPRVMARAQSPLLGAAPVPASNPVGLSAAAVTTPRGYEQVWDDGRVNTNRGVRRAIAGAVVAQPVARVSTRTVPQAVAPAPQATSHRYVQIGTYGDAGNAQRAVARLQGLGLPVGVAQMNRNGQALQVVAAGPFGDASALQNALRAARSAGYGDAFTRR